MRYPSNQILGRAITRVFVNGCQLGNFCTRNPILFNDVIFAKFILRQRVKSLSVYPRYSRCAWWACRCPFFIIWWRIVKKLFALQSQKCRHITLMLIQLNVQKAEWSHWFYSGPNILILILAVARDQNKDVLTAKYIQKPIGIFYAFTEVFHHDRSQAGSWTYPHARSNKKVQKREEKYALILC